MNLIEHVISLLAPHECLQCGAEGPLLCFSCRRQVGPVAEVCYRCGCSSHGARVCPRCRKHSRLYAVTCRTEYEGAAKRLVYGLKFGRQKRSAKVIAELLASRLPDLPRQQCIITNVPTAAHRVRVRGYDQAAEIAKYLAEQLGLPYAPLLGRMGRQRQVGQKRAVRLSQLQGAFYVTRPADCTGRYILLVDDVLTTGASLEAAAAVLRQAGASRVSGAVFAVAR